MQFKNWVPVVGACICVARCAVNSHVVSPSYFDVVEDYVIILLFCKWARMQVHITVLLLHEALLDMPMNRLL